MAFEPEHIRKAVIALTLGGIAGAAIVQSHHDEAKKSRAEINDPEGTEWICNIVWGLLDDWEAPDMDCEGLHRPSLPVLASRDRRGARTGRSGRVP